VKQALNQNVTLVQTNVYNGKTTKNKLSLKVNIPANNKDNLTTHDKQMFYIPDTSQCTEELNVTAKSQTKADIEKVRVKEAR
jgi:hypothetical protein